MTAAVCFVLFVVLIALVFELINGFHVTTSIMGGGATKRLNAVKWKVVGRIVIAWIFTLPVSAALAFGIARLLQMAGIY